MVFSSSFSRISVTFLASVFSLIAQEIPTNIVAKVDSSIPPASIGSAADGNIMTRRDARTITLKIPAPRGQIVDREGEPFAQNRVAYQLALQFRQFENDDRDFVVNWARTRLNSLQTLVKNATTKTDDELYDHYRHRRWLPLLVSGQIGASEATAIEPKLSSGLLLHPIYRRIYPEDKIA